MYKKILVPLDGSAPSERGLQEAIGLAQAHQARLLLLHVLDEYPLLLEANSAALAFEQVRTQLREQGLALLARTKAQAAEAGVQADTELRETVAYRVAPTIVQACEDAACDLVVMGTHGRRGLQHVVLGSDAETVVRLSRVPVLLVRPAV